MQKRHLNNLIASLLVTSFVASPLFIVTTEKAQAQGLGLGGVSGYVSGLAPAIATLPQCKEIINNQIEKLFSGIKDLLSRDTFEERLGKAINKDFKSKESQDELDELDRLTREQLGLDDATYKALSQTDSVKVSDDEVIRNLEAQGKALTKINIATERLNANSSCIASIGRLMAKMLLQKLTVSTVKWINGGFDGSPAYIQDPGKFFGDIAKSEILQFGLEINDDARFPFGKQWLRDTARAFNSKVQDNMQYSLDELIQATTPQYSAITFREDFRYGGWNAWRAMTQVPANNPIGSKLMMDNEIQRRLAGTSRSRAEDIREALQAADGFLGDQRCIDFDGNITKITREQEWDALEETPPRRICAEWRYVTPGSLIARAATNAIDYPKNALLNVQDLNDAVAAILDAVLGQFFPKIMEKGFALLGDDGSDGRLIFAKSGSTPYRSRTEKDFTPVHLTSSWLSSNPEFDIRTDLTQALIDEQRTYIDKLKAQSKELSSTTDGKEYKLDIPAENEGAAINAGTWQSTSADNKSGTWEMGPASGTWTATVNTGGTSTAMFSSNTVTAPSKTWASLSSPFGSGIWDITSGTISEDPVLGFFGTWTNVDTNVYGVKGLSGVSNAYGLLPAIYQLDYCIPGPHPGWEDDSRRILNTAMDLVVPQTAASLKDVPREAVLGMVKGVAPLLGALLVPAILTAGAAGANSVLFGIGLGSAAGPVGVIIGAAVGAAIAGLGSLILGTDEEEKVRLYYAGHINNFTGYLPDYKDDNDDRTLNISSKSGMVHIMNEILSRYINIMNKTYFSSSDILPSVAKEAATYFNQARGYNQMMINNENKISLLKTTVNLLGDIKTEVDKLNTEYKDEEGRFYDPDKEAEYESKLKTQINAFGRLSAGMVNGNDIAGADNLLKHIIDRKNYIYKNLLKGPYGCEAFLEDPKNIKQFPPAGGDWYVQGRLNWNGFNVNSVQRAIYPFPILYDYSTYDDDRADIGKTLPDPWAYLWGEDEERPAPTKVPDANANLDTSKYNMYDEGNKRWFGPGFLSFVFLSANVGGDDERVRGPERLWIHDLVPQWNKPDHRYKALGKRRGSSEGKYPYAGPFETIIGVY